jgi:hypothetical protein
MTCQDFVMSAIALSAVHSFESEESDGQVERVSCPDKSTFLLGLNPKSQSFSENKLVAGRHLASVVLFTRTQPPRYICIPQPRMQSLADSDHLQPATALFSRQLRLLCLNSTVPK